MLRVVVMGERGEGKTSLAIAIGLLLRRLGNDVQMMGHDAASTKWLETELKRIDEGSDPAFGFEGKSVNIEDTNLTQLPESRAIELMALRQKYERLLQFVCRINDESADFVDHFGCKPVK